MKPTNSTFKRSHHPVSVTAMSWWLIGILFSAPCLEGATLLKLHLQPDGSAKPPGDRVDAEILLNARDPGARLEVRAFVVSGLGNKASVAVKARTRPYGDASGNLLMVSTLKRQSRTNLIKTQIVIPYAELVLPMGTHQIAYEVRGLVNGKVAFVKPTRLTLVRISDRTRKLFRYPKVKRTEVVKKDVKYFKKAGDKIKRRSFTISQPRTELVLAAKPLKAKIAGEFTRMEIKSEAVVAAAYSLEQERESYRTRPWKPERKKVIEFVTNRNIERPDGVADRFGNQVSGELSFGRALVNIPVEIHQEGELELPNWWSAPDSDKFFAIDTLNVVKREVFVESIGKALRAGRNDVLLFVHGYNNTFEFATLRLAQLVHDIHFTGTPMLFSWPSQGSAEAYGEDEVIASNSVPQLAEVLLTLISERQKAGTNGCGKIHLIAHSLGNRVLLHAIQAISDRVEAREKVFGQIILAAPDIDAQDFVIVSPYAFARADSVCLYFCSEDKALKMSQVVHLNQRVGQALFCLSPLINIGADRANTSWLGHDYFVSTSPLLSDLRLALVEGKLPSQRETLRHLQPPGICEYYEFP